MDLGPYLGGAAGDFQTIIFDGFGDAVEIGTLMESGSVTFDGFFSPAKVRVYLGDIGAPKTFLFTPEKNVATAKATVSSIVETVDSDPDQQKNLKRKDHSRNFLVTLINEQQLLR